MKKITIHYCDSVSEYFLQKNNQIVETKYMTGNTTKNYVYDKKNPLYKSLIDLFNNNESLNQSIPKKRTINEYRQNKDSHYMFMYN